MFARRRDMFIRKLAMQFFSVMSNLMDAIAELVSLARHLVELSVSNLCAAGGFCVSRVVVYPAVWLACGSASTMVSVANTQRAWSRACALRGPSADLLCSSPSDSRPFSSLERLPTRFVIGGCYA